MKINFLAVVLFLLVVGAGVSAYFLMRSPDRYLDDRFAESDTSYGIQNDGSIPAGMGSVDEPVTPSEVPPVQQENTAPEPAPVVSSTDTSTTVSTSHQKLITELEKLIADKIVMKVGSRGTRVGTVQEFLNIYNNTKTPVDNQFGEGTKNAVIKFQKAEGLTADGQPGPSAYQKMIDWLKAQG